MKTALAATLFAVASFPLLGQQMPSSSPSDQPTSPTAQQPASPAETQSPGQQPNTPASRPETNATPSSSASEPADTKSTATQVPAADMRPVDGKLVTKLDTKTAKTGDDIVVQTESSVKTADGTEIPKGSKLVGHVLAVHPSAGENSQVVLRFDRAELKGGKTLPIQSEIESVSAAGSDESASNAGAMPPMREPSAAANPAGGSSSASSASAAGETTPNTPAPANTRQPGTSAASAASSSPAAGTIVSRNGNIAIRTTSIPGVLLANNAPGEQDPRMAEASGYLLGARKDVELNNGTRMTLKVATANPASSTSAGSTSPSTH
jgi:hypothetical protein